MNLASVVFTPSGKQGKFALGTPILQAARSLGVDVDSVCGGRGICARCQITHVTGKFPKFGIISKESHLSSLDATEVKLVQKKNKVSTWANYFLSIIQTN